MKDMQAKTIAFLEAEKKAKSPLGLFVSDYYGDLDPDNLDSDGLEFTGKGA